jgi:quercetin dioxygenase-like cupin family protein
VAWPGALADAVSGPAVTILEPADVRYVEDARVSGVGVAVVSGDPRSGFYTLRVRFAPGVKVPAHLHPDDRTVTVLSGTYYFGVGDRFDADGLAAHGPGTVIVVPKGIAHYAAAGDEEVVLQEAGGGPTANSIVEPADAPLH